MKCFKKYVVGAALVFMHLAAVDYFCPMIFFQHSDFWLQVGVWKQHDSNVKCFYFSQARNVEIGRSYCSSAYRRSIFGSSAVHKMERDSCVCSAPNRGPKIHQLLEHHRTDPPCPEKATGDRNLLPYLSLALQSWQSWYLQYRPGQAALTTFLVAFGKVLNFNYFLCCANIGDTAVPNPNICRTEV